MSCNLISYTLHFITRLRHCVDANRRKRQAKFSNVGDKFFPSLDLFCFVLFSTFDCVLDNTEYVMFSFVFS